uniref:Uncharacterized protein n=1 Tax=Acrobeloides nanus TaxID=290746 RepID=A0A914BW74_9BILA
MAIQENFLDSFYCLDLDDIEPVSEQKPNCSKLSNYTAFDNSDEWFLKTTPENIDGLDKREFLHSVASYYYSNENFALAYEKFCELLNVGGHNRACRLSILDSMIRCLIKETSQNLNSIKPSLVQHLQGIEPLVSTYGEQLQFWELKASIPHHIVSNFEIFKTTVLLCSSCDCSKFWRLFEKIPSETNSNFRIGILCRVWSLLKQEAENSSGFVRENFQTKALKAEKFLRENFEEEKITEARKHVCFDLEKISSECTNLADQPPPHKVKNTGSARNRQEQEKIFEDFMKKFSWLFVDNVNVLNGLK